MTNQAMANKGWFLHIGGQPQGPFTVEQVALKFREGTINRDSHVWCEGMPAWVTAKDVPELGTAFAALPPVVAAVAPPPLIETPAPAPAQTASRGNTGSFAGPDAGTGRTGKTNTTEVSHLIELNPHEVDDTTAAIDPAKLRLAQKEAAAAKKVERKISVANSVVGISSGDEPKSRKLLVVAIPLLAFAGIGGAVVLKMGSLEDFKVQTSRFLSGLTSSLAPIDDVTPESYDVLRAAADADLKTAGPQAAIAISTQTPEKPILYISTNLPDGANLSVQVKGDPKTILADKGVSIRFPLMINKHLAKSRNLHTAEGTDFPPGEYTVTVVPADEDQTPEVKAALAAGKLLVTQNFFVGGTKDAAFNSKLDQLHQKQRDKALVEYKQGALLVSKLETQFALAAETSQQLQSAKKPNVKKIWDELNKKWAAGDMEPLEKGNAYPDVFTAIHDLWAQGKKIHELQANAAQGAGDQTATWSQISALSADSTQKVAAIKARLEAIAKEVGASAAAPVPGH